MPLGGGSAGRVRKRVGYCVRPARRSATDVLRTRVALRASRTTVGYSVRPARRSATACSARRSPTDPAQTFDVEASAAITWIEANPATEPVGVSDGLVDEAHLG